MDRTLSSLIVIATFAVAACGAGTPSGSPRSMPTAAPSAGASSAAASAATGDGSDAGQTDTEWGRIWDTLPPGFPTYPGGTPDDSAGGDPASAVIVIDGLDAKDAATFLETLLKKAGFTTVGSLDPLEDGSVVLEMTGATEGCRIRATAAPTGGVTTVRILYGSDCPFV